MGNYITNSLEKGEQIVFQGRLHWTSIVRYLFAAVLSLLIAVGLAVAGYFNHNSVLYYVAAGFLVVAAIIWFIGRIVRTRSEFAVTNSRFIQKDGILNIKMTEIPLFKIETVNFYQSFWQRLLGTGCIELVGSGGTFHRVHFIQHPQRVRKTIVSTINEHGHNEQE